MFPLLALAAVAAGCAHRDALLRRPAAPLDAVVVATMALDYEPAPHEAALRTEDVLDELWRACDWAVVSPGEVRLRAGAGPTALLGSDIGPRAAALGVDPRRLGVLITRARLHEPGGDAGGDGARREPARMTLSLALHDSESRPLLELAEDVELDPYAEHPSADSRPELRGAIARAVRRLVGACTDCVRAVTRLGYAVRTNPAAVLAREGTRGLLPGPDELDLMTDRLAVVHYFDPTVTLREAERLFAIGAGVCLAEDGPGDLAAGDCIAAVDGHELDGPHAFARALVRGGGHEIALVRRGTSTRTRIPYPAP